MRHLVISVIIIVCALTANAQIKIGQSINDLQVKDLLNAPVKQIDLNKLKGKVIWLEFWATWCSPCVSAMPHLQKLQKAYKGKMQVIAISNEKEKRIRQFISNRPSNFWFSIDTADTFRSVFPYHIIPQSVLIDQNGVVVAITLPENITEQTIADVIAGKKISLPLKEDNMVKDPWGAYFSADPSTSNRFLVQPKIEGQVSGYKRYLKDSIFKNRRVSLLNIPLENAYRIAYGDLPYGRTVDLTLKENVVENKKMYCIDLIVPKGHEADLMPTLRKELKARFDLQANIEKRRKMVYVLTIADSSKVANLKRSAAKEENFSANHGAFHGENIELKAIADYLEGFGLVNLPVLDGTDNNYKYDIDFTFMPEKKADLENVLLNMGLQLKKEERDIDMLVFR